MINYTPRLDEAMRVAAMAHSEQTRKGTDIPYIVHPFAVMYIVSQATNDEDVLIASLFHDIIEDVPDKYSKEQMQRAFGARVVRIVEGVTKDDTIEDWQGRADAYLDHLRTADIESVMVSGADKIHNLQSILLDYERYGEELWTRFNAGKESQLWWYESILEVLQERIPESPLTETLDNLTAKLKPLVLV
ncbi:MAG TPA: HD domain-containing protein [Candidatus Saccharimonadales bacterium]|jgi:(p)ppGpp synthase/HD superfamily hydrolase|nr:HD domain-containing protein [Candidatus Saccharimonadales bacterium]